MDFSLFLQDNRLEKKCKFPRALKDGSHVTYVVKELTASEDILAASNAIKDCHEIIQSSGISIKDIKTSELYDHLDQHIKVLVNNSKTLWLIYFTSYDEATNQRLFPSFEILKKMNFSPREINEFTENISNFAVEIEIPKIDDLEKTVEDLVKSEDVDFLDYIISTAEKWRLEEKMHFIRLLVQELKKSKN
jgi:hypothetical protein